MAAADVILLNKVDLVKDPAHLQRIDGLLRCAGTFSAMSHGSADSVSRRINPTAIIHRTQNSNIELGKILDLNMFNAPDGPRSAALDTVASTQEAPACSSDCAEQHEHQHKPHAGDISSVVIPLPDLADVRGGRFDELIREMLWDGKAPGGGESVEVLRTKGFLRATDGSAYVLQGVRDLYDITSVSDDGTGAPKLVFIGRKLPATLRDDFLRALR